MHQESRAPELSTQALNHEIEITQLLGSSSIATVAPKVALR